MKTPIYDFLKAYSKSNFSRLHMPGHKGKGFLGIESFDITEIKGADNLFDACDIINESEENAACLFDTGKTLYSAEGSTLAIKTMLSLAYDKAKNKKTAKILSARNVHKSFVFAAALLDFGIEWMYGGGEHLCSCDITPDEVEECLSGMEELPFAVYVTSPDYLGHVLDIRGIAKVCERYSLPLLVDNAHGAYRAFLSPSEHPIAMGAAMCCDSAHKTLPVLTGGAYLHISRDADPYFLSAAKSRMAVFASTSPSYLILSSLDLCNKYLSEGYKDRLSRCISRLELTKKKLSLRGISIADSEPLKLVIKASNIGYSGEDIAEILRKFKVEPEFCDYEYAVLMFSPENDEEDFLRVESALLDIPIHAPLRTCEFIKTAKRRVMSVREAVFSESELVDVSESEGRIAASPTVSCPPAVPVVVSGEVISKEDIFVFESYGIKTVLVVKR